jgi:predicted Rossmann fold nucleotide-binding protein DprA/Smf involved in DNA uptake
MNPNDAPLFSLGNRDLLELPKTAFLCSEDIPDSAVTACHDWSIAQRTMGRCVISGFQSEIEQDVFHYLIKGTQPIIIALARGLITRLDPALSEAIAHNRLLIITPFPEEVERATAETVERRNRTMIGLADEIVFGFVNKNGSLENLIIEFEHKKQMMVL